MSLLLRPVPLLTLAALALGIAASLYAAPFGLFLLVILLSWTFKYSIALLDALLDGKKTMPVLSVEMIVASLHQWRLLIALGLTVSMFFIASAAMHLQSRSVLAVLAAVLPLTLPAMLTVQAWTHSTAQALHPGIAISVGRLLGADYLKLVLIVAALVVLIAVVATRLPILPLRIAIYLLCWFTIVVQLGQVVRARRQELEAATFFPAPLDFSESAESLAAAREHAADEIYAHWRNGAKQEAWNAALRYASAARHPAEEWFWLQRRVGLWGADALKERIDAALRDAMGKGPG